MTGPHTSASPAPLGLPTQPGGSTADAPDADNALGPELAGTHYRVLLGSLPDTVVALYDHRLRGVSIDGPLVQLAGFDRRTFEGLALRDFLSPPDAALLEPYYTRALEGHNASVEYRPTGSEKVYRLEVAPFRATPQAEISGVFTVARDITAQDRARDESRQRTRQQAVLAALGVAALEGLGLTDLMDRAVAAVADTLNLEFSELLELTEGRESLLLRAGSGWREGLVRRALVPAGSDWHAGFAWGSRGPVVVEDYAHEQRFAPTRLLKEHGAASGISVIVGAKLRPHGVLGVHSSKPRSFSAFEVDFVQAVANVLAEAVARDAAERRIRHQALHDPLTGLPNRTLLLERLQHWFERAGRGAGAGALLFVDLDNFKQVNDRHGHEAGDTIIREVAQRLAGHVRASDTVARVGGDEFLILCEDLEHEQEAVALAERLRRCLNEPFTIGEQPQDVTASIGLTLSRGQGTTDALIRDADAAMYRAKERGPGQYEIFDEQMRDWSRRWRRAEDDLRRGLAQGEFFNLYQPIVCLQDGRVLGFEALVRWRHPERGMVSPAEFIPAAEQSGLIVQLGDAVLHRACQDAAGWNSGDREFRVSVNLSPRQLSHPALVNSVRDELKLTGLAADRLSLELTESALIEDSDGALRTLDELKALGVRLELDDFGTGYSSLTFARRFPIDALKIDRSFIDGLIRSPEDAAIVSAVIALGLSLGLNVVAEGVESDEQAERLRAMHCPLAQGFLFARPLAAADADALTRSDRSLAGSLQAG